MSSLRPSTLRFLSSAAASRNSSSSLSVLYPKIIHQTTQALPTPYHRNIITRTLTNYNKFITETRIAIPSPYLKILFNSEEKSSSTIHQLPEVKQALQLYDTQSFSAMLPLLEKSIEILSPFVKEEEIAALTSLLAHVYSLLGDYKSSSKMLDKLLIVNKHSSFIKTVILDNMRLKSLVYGGRFDEACALETSIVSSCGDDNKSKLDKLSFESNKALAHILSICSNSSCDGDENVDKIETLLLQLQKNLQELSLLLDGTTNDDKSGTEETYLKLAVIITMINFARARSLLIPSNNSPTQEVLSSLKTSMLIDDDNGISHNTTAGFVKAWSRIHICQMIYDDKERRNNEETLKEASELAQQALSFFEQQQQQTNFYDIYMGISLGLIATSYKRAGAAVTGEGLYNSALDLISSRSAKQTTSPLPILQHMWLVDNFANLYDNWEKREKDAVNMRKRNTDLLPLLLQGWNRIYSKALPNNATACNFWIWAPEDFHILSDDMNNSAQ